MLVIDEAPAPCFNGRMVKAVIFDLNGVFIQSPKLSDRFQERFGIPASDFLLVLKEIMARVRTPGAGDAFAYWQPYLKVWSIELTKGEFFNFWFSAEKEVPEMVELARNLKNRGVKVFILSNNFVERAAYYDANFPFLREVADTVYYSWQTGFVKPNPEAYRKILSDNNLKPEECVYFDDAQENIDAAKSLGIASFRYQGSGETKERVKQLL